jgi:uncharacterized protein YjbI with pentapeptide repeats
MEAKFERADMMFAELSGADLRSSLLTEANLFGADLSKADFTRADLQRSNMTDAKILGAIFQFAKMTDCIATNGKPWGFSVRSEKGGRKKWWKGWSGSAAL